MNNDKTIDWSPLEVSDDYLACSGADPDEIRCIEEELYCENDHRGGQTVQVWRWKANDLLHAEIYRNAQGEAHRDEADGPAETYYNEQGKPYWWKHRKNGLLHRVNGPAEVRICPWGRLTHSEKIWAFEGLEHRSGGKPSYLSISYDIAYIGIRFCTHGKRHRSGDLPAEITYDDGKRTREFYMDGYRHRPNGAAIEEADLRTGRKKQSYWLWGHEYPGPEGNTQLVCTPGY